MPIKKTAPNLYRPVEKTVIAGQEVEFIKPGLVQIPQVTQFIVQGLAPTFLNKTQLAELTTMQIFEEAIKYVTEISTSELPEDEKSSVWGAALITSDASLNYLFPAMCSCFPSVELDKVTDEVLNELMTLFFTSYFELLQAGS